MERRLDAAAPQGFVVLAELLGARATFATRLWQAGARKIPPSQGRAMDEKQHSRVCAPRRVLSLVLGRRGACGIGGGRKRVE
jgi:hypothetical protein